MCSTFPVQSSTSVDPLAHGNDLDTVNSPNNVFYGAVQDET